MEGMYVVDGTHSLAMAWFLTISTLIGAAVALWRAGRQKEKLEKEIADLRAQRAGYG